MKFFIEKVVGRWFRFRTLKLIYIDLIRMKARGLFPKRNITPRQTKLHLGCGSRKASGWLNVDVSHSDCNVDLASGRLPWKSHCFDVAVAQHLIDDLDLNRELIPLLKELKRVLRNGGELWLSCPDMEKICRSYLDDHFKTLIEDRQKRIPRYNLQGLPSSQFFNDLVYEGGNNINFFDFDLLKHILESCGFTNCTKTTETELLNHFPGFPPRKDDMISLYVKSMICNRVEKNQTND